MIKSLRPKIWYLMSNRNGIFEYFPRWLCEQTHIKYRHHFAMFVPTYSKLHQDLPTKITARASLSRSTPRPHCQPSCSPTLTRFRMCARRRSCWTRSSHAWRTSTGGFPCRFCSTGWSAAGKRRWAVCALLARFTPFTAPIRLWHTWPYIAYAFCCISTVLHGPNDVNLLKHANLLSCTNILFRWTQNVIMRVCCRTYRAGASQNLYRQMDDVIFKKLT